jgi:hypothetical protein
LSAKSMLKKAIVPVEDTFKVLNPLYAILFLVMINFV